MSSIYKECTRCMMNTSIDKLIKFNDQGLCNHCQRYDQLVRSRVVSDGQSSVELNKLVTKIKNAARGGRYDCIIGLSGGVDSTYVAYFAKELGLKPLAVHFDNGWNSELAVKNIENTLRLLDIDLHTYVVDWEEFKDLQRSFLFASTPDGEIPTDHGIYAALWRIAAKYRIKYIITGMNFASESMSIPNWSYGHSDYFYIKNIAKRFGSYSLKTFPGFSIWYLFYVTFILRIQRVSILNYIQYNKDDAIKIIKDKLNWTPYGGKHHESIYTRFWQGVVLPEKFGIDKRYAHLSDLINSGQITKDEAINEIKNPTYSLDLQKSDRSYVAKKLGFTSKEFEGVMMLPVKNFNDYPNNYFIINSLKKIVDFLRKKNAYPK
jgi:N-acetyl sugar amidotransferase